MNATTTSANQDAKPKPDAKPLSLQRMVRRLIRARILNALLSQWRWYRRLHGGHWELWNIDHPVCSACWCDVRQCSKPTGYREPGWRGTPMCEEWP